MNLFKVRLQYLWKIWPLWGIVSVAIFTCYFGDFSTPFVKIGFDKLASAALQGLGATLILLSIDDNLRLFLGHGMFAEIREYFQA